MEVRAVMAEPGAVLGLVVMLVQVERAGKMVLGIFKTRQFVSKPLQFQNFPATLALRVHFLPP